MGKFRKLIFLFTIFAVILNYTGFAQNGVVTIGGEVEKPLKLDADIIKKMAHVTVKSISHSDHKEHQYSGIPLSEIIRESGAIPGNQLRGKYLGKYVLVTGADGYQVVIALAETDTAFTDKVIILADTEDDKALPSAAGPFQIIVPDDKKPARCVRQVVSINILSAKLN